MIKKISFYFLLILFFFVFCLYSLEILLAFWNHSSIKSKKWQNLDRSRLSVYEKEKKINDNISLTISPTNFLKDDTLSIFPLAGLPNKQTINCNESGYWSRFNSDQYGFNNPKEEWSKGEYEFVLIGDSFLLGDCVNFPNDISNQIRAKLKLNNNKSGVLNLGYGGNGPLIEYASLREYFPNKKVDKILIFFSDANDFNDFNLEIENPILRKYFDNKNFSQDLKNKQDRINKILLEKFNSEIEKKNDNRLIRFNEIKFSRLLKLTNLRHRLLWQFNLVLIKEGENNELVSKNEELLKDLFNKIKTFADQKNSDLYFVFLTGYPGDSKGDKIFNIINSLNIPIINIKKEVFDKHKDPLSLFPFRKMGHYTEEGYNLISNKIIELAK
tara:strand:+ start:2482 stop:3636 length:1155 start_codon:yes stop_codon:yes gene_type:complete